MEVHLNLHHVAGTMWLAPCGWLHVSTTLTSNTRNRRICIDSSTVSYAVEESKQRKSIFGVLEVSNRHIQPANKNGLHRFNSSTAFYAMCMNWNINKLIYSH